MTLVYAYTRHRDPTSGEVILSGNEWEASRAPMTEVVAMTLRTWAGTCAVDPALGVAWATVNRLAPGAAATVQYVISQALARYVSAGLITGLAVAATQAASTRIDYVVSFSDPRMDGGPLRITGAF